MWLLGFVVLEHRVKIAELQDRGYVVTWLCLNMFVSDLTLRFHRDSWSYGGVTDISRVSLLVLTSRNLTVSMSS